MQRSKQIKTYLDQMIEQRKTPGLSYVAMDQNNVLFSYSKGYCNIAEKSDVDEKTTFNAYSVTKTFTAIAVLQLVEEKLLSLDGLVSKYYPENPYGNITIRQLLSHTAGLPNPIPINWIHLASEDPSFDYKKFVDEIIKKHGRRKDKPGKKFSYSNIGFLLLGRVIENVSGMPYRDYIRQNILYKIPVERNEIDFVINSYKDHAKGYQKTRSLMNLLLGFFINKKKYMSGKEGHWSAFKDLYVNGSAYGGLIGSACAFSRYLQQLLREDSDLISGKYKYEMFTQQKLANGKEINMGLGWFHGTLKSREYFTHPGGGGGYYSELRIYPKNNLATLIMLNRSGMSDERILDDIDGYILE